MPIEVNSVKKKYKTLQLTEENLTRKVGLWIDHRKAVIVSISGNLEETKSIISDMEKHVRFSDEGSETSKSEDVRDRQFGNHLDSYYDLVIDEIRDGTSIQIFGPGEAKGELKKRLESKDLGGRIISVESADKLTDRQIAARVRENLQENKRNQ
jgi:hypothetical protein